MNIPLSKSVSKKTLDRNKRHTNSTTPRDINNPKAKTDMLNLV